ncbi:hypothetical protein [Photorhabdus khanii]|uniref:Butirosin biosynthesis protein H N-terminal domain-containing protein n=1 Tax=Photorhabdus khanii subsp. guanajuatensis TaxID=2100166 RepID=A0A4R4JJ30_9GAMM|nr:hypothetical protein [Photorhabdus khanii]TDB54297.1 hypothetical protein C5467_13975 [Photorhabdus khanii subsp. guanajuatensis]
MENMMDKSKMNVAINCFTGSLTRLLNLQGKEIFEAEIFEAGNGYLFRSGYDELNMPEYTFSVETVGLTGAVSLGANMVSLPIDYTHWCCQLYELLCQKKGVVAWVNSAHLSYSEVYNNKPEYLHAVLITAIADDYSQVRIFDSLVVDRESYACEAWMPSGKFYLALSDKVPGETYDHMGHFYIVDSLKDLEIMSVRKLLTRQAELFNTLPEYYDALKNYSKLCLNAFQQPKEKACRAAKRLFDHISVLYVIPNLSLLKYSLIRADIAPALIEHCTELIGHWKALSILALKFEATLSLQVLEKIEGRFNHIDQMTYVMWGELYRYKDKSCD